MSEMKDLGDLAAAGYLLPEDGELIAGPGFVPPEPVPQQSQRAAPVLEVEAVQVEVEPEPEPDAPRVARDISAPEAPSSFRAHAVAESLAPLHLVVKGKPRSTDPDVRTELAVSTSKSGNETVLTTLSNVVAILTADRRWQGRFRRDLLSLADTLDGKRVTDPLEVGLACWLGKVYDMHVSAVSVHQAVGAVAMLRSFHPVQDYLRSLEWDGTARLDTWLTKYAGVDDADEEELVSAYGAKWLISCVARAFEPGCKVDSALVFAGPKGRGKSTTLRTMGGPWFGDSALPIGDKDGYQQIAGKWIWELAELDSLDRREYGAVKAYMSSQVDSFRASYARNVADHLRQVVFGATINSDTIPTFLREADRRWWIVRVPREANIAGLVEVRDQLWAEAVQLYRDGEPWHLANADLERLQDDSVRAYVQTDTWEALIDRYVNPPKPSGSAAQPKKLLSVKVADVLRQLGKKPEDCTKADEMRVGGILAQLGFERKRKREDGERAWAWLRPDPDAIPQDGSQ